MGSRAARYAVLALLFVLAGVSTGLYLTVRRLADVGERSAVTAEVAPAPAEAGGPAGGPSLSDDRRTAIVRAAELAGPATTSVTALRTLVVRESPFPYDETFDRFFRHYFPHYWFREERQHVFGSGVIIDPDGYVLTNEHVVGGADQVTVTLTDGREFEGRVLGSDPRYDLAVIKIDGENLPVAKLGDSDDLLVGEWAIAIGNPFGHLLNDRQPTVTAGVISALHRDIQSGGETSAIYKDMIQTDAAINPGNSGGPLVNSRGEVIGINSFIFTSSGGSQGVGFAIPINTARAIINEMIEFGRVRDVWVGIIGQEIAPRTAQRMSLPVRSGVLVTYVESESPAARAGIRRGDIIVGVNGQSVGSIREARRAIFGARVGETVTLSVMRGDKRMDFDVRLEEVPR